MVELLQNIGNIITGYTDTSVTPSVEVPGLIDWLGDVANTLISNPVFQIVLAVIVFILLFALMVGLAKGVKGGKKRRK